MENKLKLSLTDDPDKMQDKFKEIATKIDELLKNKYEITFKLDGGKSETKVFLFETDCQIDTENDEWDETPTELFVELAHIFHWHPDHVVLRIRRIV